MNIRTADASLHNMSQPDSHIPGSDIVFGSDNIYIPKHNGAVCRCRSAELKSTGTEGDLEVHLVMDPADRWYPMHLVPGVECGRYFDKIRSTGTTVTVAYVNLFPAA